MENHTDHASGPELMFWRVLTRYGVTAAEVTAAAEGPLFVGSPIERAVVALEHLFFERFGRDRAEDEPLLFDPGATVPVPLAPARLEAALVEVLERGELNPAIVYAVQQTGRWVDSDNALIVDENDLAEWNAAVDRYLRLTSRA